MSIKSHQTRSNKKKRESLELQISFHLLRGRVNDYILSRDFESSKIGGDYDFNNLSLPS